MFSGNQSLDDSMNGSNNNNNSTNYENENVNDYESTSQIATNNDENEDNGQFDDQNKTENLIKINIYENEKSLYVLNRTEKIIRNKNAFKGMKATQKKHHTGPIKTEFIEDSLGRAKTKRVRKATLFKKAKELYSTTNLDVAVMVLDNKKIDSYFSPNGLLEKNILKNLTKLLPTTANSLATSSSSLTIPNKKSTSEPVIKFEENNQEIKINDPTIRKVTKNDTETQYDVEDLEYTKTVCSICNVTFNSKYDRIPSPFLNYAWLKCQRGRCDYWVHNFCIGLGLEDEKTVKSLKFLCPKHTLDV